jgi:hypothetical protein
MTTTEEPINQASQQAQQRESVKHLPERLSRRYRNCVLNLSSSYRNPMVKHEPELHTHLSARWWYPVGTGGEVVELRQDAK